MSDCFNCGSAGSIGSADQFRMSCSPCGAWVVNLDKTTEYSSLYSENYLQGKEYIDYEGSAEAHRLNFWRKLLILKKYLSDLNSVRLLEIGPASGEFLLEAMKQGFKHSIGIEISEHARNKALARKLNVHDSGEKDLLLKIREFRPNLIVMWDVWEHLPRPAEELKNYLSHSADNCIVAITTVDAGSAVARNRQEKWRQFHPPTHINYPTGKSFEKLFTALNMRIIEKSHFGYYRPLAEYLVAMLGMRNWILRSRTLFRIPLYLNLYDTQLIIARKNK